MKLFLFLLSASMIFAQDDLTYDMTAVETALADNLEACSENAPDGGQPLPGGCGCDYPDEFCFWYPEEDSTTGLSSIEYTCVALSDDCKAAIEDALAGVTSGTDSTDSTTAGSTESTTSGTGGTTASGDTTASGGTTASGATDDTTTDPCDDGDDTTTAASSDGTTTAGSEDTTTAGTDDTTTEGDGDTDTSGCSDFHDYCCWWAGQGDCDSNPYFMRPVCQKSCGTCGCNVASAEDCSVSVNTAGCKWDSDGGDSTDTGTGNGNGNGNGSSGCSNTHIWCNFWKSKGECEKNPWMNTGCAKACGQC